MKKIFQYQGWHLAALLILLSGLFLIIRSYPEVLEGSLLGISTKTWFTLTILAPILHQVYVVVCWRYQLYTNGLKEIFGKNAFRLYKFGFALLILSRAVTMVFLAISNAGSLHLTKTLRYGLALLLALPATYLFYSVKRYFGMDRAFGIDHFEPEKYRDVPFVKRGIFKYTNNGMYIYGFLALWIPGILTGSKAALLAALFNHLYIWVHYYCTELPDIRYIYDQKKDMGEELSGRGDPITPSIPEEKQGSPG